MGTTVVKRTFYPLRPLSDRPVYFGFFKLQQTYKPLNNPAGVPAEALAKAGGARRDRTADLLHAMQALSQLSYGPKG